MNKVRGAKAYAKVGVESRVLSASQVGLIVQLFNRAESEIRAALIHIDAGNIAERGQSISKAIEVVQNGLLASLNMETEGDIATNLYNLYEYVVKLLMEANRECSKEKLDQASKLLAPIAESFRAIDAGSV